MQIYIIVVLLLYSGAVSGGLEKVFILAEFIADIYQQFPHSCIFIINSEAQQQGKDWFHIIYSSFLCVVKRNVLTETLDGKCLGFPIYNKDLYFEWCKFSEWERNKFSYLPISIRMLHICVVYFVCKL